MLEKIIKQSDIKDGEDKSVLVQAITCSELIRVKNKHVIPPFDKEILNVRQHIERIGDVWDKPETT